MLSLLKNVKHLKHITKLKDIIEQRNNRKGVILELLLGLALELGIKMIFSLGFLNIFIMIFCSFLGIGAFYYSYKNNKILKKKNNNVILDDEKEIRSKGNERNYSDINLMEIIENNRRNSPRQK